jgi:hypothetical protein
MRVPRRSHMYFSGFEAVDSRTLNGNAEEGSGGEEYCSESHDARFRGRSGKVDS